MGHKLTILFTTTAEHLPLVRFPAPTSYLSLFLTWHKSDNIA